MIGLPSIFAALALMQTPAAQAPAGPEPREILTRALDVYAAAKTYDALWTYTNVRGNETQEMQIEVKAKAPARLIFKVSAARGARKTGQRAVPEMLVVLDGTHAWFENTSEKKGIDGIIVMSSGSDCPYEGAYARLSARISRVYGRMKELGIPTNRLKLTTVCTVCKAAFLKEIREMQQAVLSDAAAAAA